MPATCLYADVSGGNRSLGLPLQQNGTVGCISELLTTVTTLVTYTRSDTSLQDTETTVASFHVASSQTSSTGVSITSPSPAFSQTVTTAPTSTGTCKGCESVPNSEQFSPQSTAKSVTQPSKDAIFQNSTASRISPSIVPIIMVSVFSTLTIMKTAGVPCDATSVVFANRTIS